MRKGSEIQETSEVDLFLIKKEEYYITKPVNLDIKEVYRDMTILREMEVLLDELYQKNQIQGFCHLVIGQEAIYVALKNILRKGTGLIQGGDKVIGSYRCHGLAYASSISPQEIVSETIGKYNGNCKGKGGSMHLYNETFYGGHGIVGAQVALGTGLAYALKYKGSQGVCFAFYGDGAANQGQVYESFNMAKLWKLPIVFVCENNGFGMWTPESKVSSYSDYYKRGLNIPGLRIKGNDFNELLRAFSFSKEHAKVNGPIIIQIDTYRTCGHSCVDKTNFYRDQEEVEMKKAEDGLSKIRSHFLSLMGEEEVLRVEEASKKFISDVYDFSHKF